MQNYSEDSWESFDNAFDSFVKGIGDWKVSLLLSDLSAVEGVDAKTILDPENYENVFYRKDTYNIWELIVKLKNGYYCLFRTSHSKGGFKNTDVGEIIFCACPHTFFHFAFNEDLKEKYPDFVQDAVRWKRMLSLQREKESDEKKSDGRCFLRQ